MGRKEERTRWGWGGRRKSRQKEGKTSMQDTGLLWRKLNPRFPSKGQSFTPTHSSQSPSSDSWLQTDKHKTGFKSSFPIRTLQNPKLIKIEIDFKLALFLLLSGYMHFHAYHLICVFSQLLWNRYYYPKCTNKKHRTQVKYLSCVAQEMVGLGLRLVTLILLCSRFSVASWFLLTFLIPHASIALAFLDLCLDFASLVWASCLVTSNCYCPHLNLSICQFCIK